MTKKTKKTTDYLPNEELGYSVICPKCGRERDVFHIDEKITCGCSNSECKYKINIIKNISAHVVIKRHRGS